MISAAAVIWVLVVGLSRIYLGVHWASDVIGGWALGALWSAAVITTAAAMAGADPPVETPPSSPESLGQCLRRRRCP